MPTTYGDTVGTLDGTQSGAGQTLDIAAGPILDAGYLFGDAATITGRARGANDVLTVSGPADPSLFAFVYGDSTDLLEHGRGGKDRIVGASGVYNEAYGDAFFMDDSAAGGADRLTGGSGAGTTNLLVGDGGEMHGDSRGAADTLLGGDAGADNALYGDALFLIGQAQGGDDLIIGGKGATNVLRGDAEDMVDAAAGGNDTLTGGARGSNTLHGDAEILYDTTRGGDDRLVSGARADDAMWGDGLLTEGATGGADVFVFAARNGRDTIHDFEQGKDLIDLSALGLSGFEALSIRVSGGDSTILLDGGRVTVLGVAALQETDFIFI